MSNVKKYKIKLESEFIMAVTHTYKMTQNDVVYTYLQLPSDQVFYKFYLVLAMMQ